MVNKWKLELLNEDLHCNNGIYSKHFNDSIGSIFHKKMPKGAALRELEKKLYHLSYWETPYYKKALDRFLANIENTNDKIFIDIGCGDGRFTQYLLNQGVEKIIAIDTDLTPLTSLYQYLKDNGLVENVLLINCSAENIPIKTQSVDVILSIGTYYYLNDRFEECLIEANRLLKQHGILINSEPDIEGAVYKSIYFEQIDDMFENLFKRMFKEEKGKTDFKFRLFDTKEIKRLFKKSGFKVVDSHRLSLLPSILRIKTVRGDIDEETIKQNEVKIRELFNYFDDNGLLAKHIIWKSIKYAYK